MNCRAPRKVRILLLWNTKNAIKKGYLVNFTVQISGTILIVILKH